MRAGTGTEAAAPFAADSCTARSWSPGADASGTLIGTVPDLRAGIVTVPAPDPDVVWLCPVTGNDSGPV